jgi:hypothetical protein
VGTVDVDVLVVEIDVLDKENYLYVAVAVADNAFEMMNVSRKPYDIAQTHVAPSSVEPIGQSSRLHTAIQHNCSLRTCKLYNWRHVFLCKTK